MSADEDEDETFYAGDGAAALTDLPPQNGRGGGPSSAPSDGASSLESYDPNAGDGGAQVIDLGARRRARARMHRARRRNLVLLALVAAALVLLIRWRLSNADAA